MADDVLISVTRLRLASARHLPRFVWLSWRAARQARRAPGFRGLRLLADRRLAFWTATAWADLASLKSYRAAGAHRAAMPAMAGWCDEGAVVRFNGRLDALDDWPALHACLLAEGEPTPLPRPSAAQVERDWAPPRSHRLADLVMSPARRIGPR